MDHDVIIIGCGPAGMFLAGDLALAGIDVAIVEKRTTRERPGGRAGGLHIRTLEILDQRGIADRFLREGQKHDKVSFHIPLDVSDLPTRHNYLLALHQKHTERLLQEWLASLNVPVYWGIGISEVSQHPSGVVASTICGENLKARWLVGCDGGRSVVRKTCGIAFPGWDATTSWLIAEASMTEEPVLGFFSDTSGRHAITRLDDGAKVSLVLAGQGAQANGTPTLSELSCALTKIYGTDFGVHSPTWLSRFNDATRQASSYRQGRVLLAGDAAHVHPPFGGQGLNLGLQDAVNLGWKLAQVVKGISSSALLDTYQSERQPVVARIMRNIIVQRTLREPGDRMAAMQDFVSEVLATDEVRKRFAAMISGLDVCYESGTHPLIGRRVPDLGIEVGGHRTTVYSLLHNARGVLIDFAGKTDAGVEASRWANRITLVEATFDGRWNLPLLGVISPPSLVLVRPDGYVAWAGNHSEEGLREALNTWFGEPL